MSHGGAQWGKAIDYHIVLHEFKVAQVKHFIVNGRKVTVYTECHVTYFLL